MYFFAFLPGRSARAALMWTLAMFTPASMAQTNAPLYGCGPSAQVRSDLDAFGAVKLKAYSQPDWFEVGTESIERLAQKYPNDLFVQRERDNWKNRDLTQRVSLIAERQAALSKAPDDPLAAFLLGRLFGSQKPSFAIRVLDRAVEAHPTFAFAHLQLAILHRVTQGISGGAAETEHLSAFLELCPLHAEAFSFLARVPGARLSANLLSAAEMRISSAEPLTPNDLSLLKGYLQLSLAASPENRAEVRRKVERLVMPFMHGNVEWTASQLQILIAMFAETENESARRWAETELLTRFPKTELGRAVQESIWEREERAGASGSQAASSAPLSKNHQLAQVEQTLVMQPYAPDVAMRRFRLLRDLPDATNTEILRAGRAAHETLRMQPRGDFVNPLPLLVIADEYAHRGMPCKDISDLAGESLAAVAYLQRESEAMFGTNTEGRKRFVAELNAQEVLALGLLSECSVSGLKATSYLGLAKQVLARMAVEPGDSTYPIHVSALARYYRASSKVLDLNGDEDGARDAKKAALTFAAQSPAGVYRPIFGTEQSLRPHQVASKRDSGQFPSINLIDIKGSKFSSDDWIGRPTLVAYWATWCGPCLAELKLLEVHREKLDKAGVRVVTVNLDEEISKALAFATRHRITFPVFMGWQQRNVLPGAREGILPVTLFLDAQGAIMHKDFGFTNQADWSEQLERRLPLGKGSAAVR